MRTACTTRRWAGLASATVACDSSRSAWPWSLFIPWLSLLGILVPPIGAIILADLYYVRPGAQIRADWRPQAFVAWAVGSLVAYVVETFVPQFSTAVSAFIAGGLCYLLLSAMSVPRADAALGTAKR